MRLSIVVGLLIGAVLAAVAAYFLPERETAITRDVVTEEIRQSVSVVGPMVKELKDLKDFRDLNK